MTDIRRLETSHYLLWATPIGDRVPFEVSKEVTQPLQPLCPTSPYCPDERIPRIRGESVHPGSEKIASVVQYIPNPNFGGVTSCPYDFKTKEMCYCDINCALMRSALFSTLESRRVANYLRSLRYAVEEERIGESDIDGSRTLKAHGMTYNFHEIRFEIGPGNLGLVMIRNPYETSSESREEETTCRS